MQINIRFSGGKRSDFGDHSLEAVVFSSLERFQHRLKQVYLYLEDVNGPRGGIDKQCRCVLHLRHLPPVVIQDQDEDATTLIYRVANRAAHALSRKTDRHNKRAVQGNSVRETSLASSDPEKKSA